jgi:site-specific DNA-methyltransferase (adenine-specific)
LGTKELEIQKSDRLAGNGRDLLAGLPYLFEDPTGLSRKTDPKKRRFDSTIDGKELSRERYFTVKRILSPEKIVLDGGLHIRLIGIVENPEKRTEAMVFLSQMTKGQRVYVRTKEGEPLDDRRAASDFLKGYLYLKNRTPINAHLIKHGLVFVDRESDYGEKERFIRLAQSIVS